MGNQTPERKLFVKIGKRLCKQRNHRQGQENKKRLTKEFSSGEEVICHWCKNPVFRFTGKPVNNSATVDHIYDRRDLRRYIVTEEENTVIGCYKCNQERNDEMILERKYHFDGKDIIDIVEVCRANTELQ